MRPRRRALAERRLPHAALLLLSALLAGTVVYLTWPGRAAIYCERLPQLTALAACGGAFLVLSFRGLAASHGARAVQVPREDRRIAGGAAILAGLSFFLAARFIAAYRAPCAAVQQQVAPHKPGSAPSTP